MKAAIYSRKSKFTGKGESIENQIQLCKEYAKTQLRDKEISEFKIYEDEGFSGGNTNRPEFQRLLEDAKTKKFDVLICYRLDRISRNVADFSTTLEVLQKYDIDFVSIREQFDTSSPMGRAMIYIASVFAQLERETIAERIRDNMLELAKTGRWLGGVTPLGYQSNQISYLDAEMNERKMVKLKQVPKELEIVELIYDKYLELKSLSQLETYMQQANIKTKRGAQFDKAKLKIILNNAVYVKANNDVMAYLEKQGITCCGVPNGEKGLLTYNKQKSITTSSGKTSRAYRDKSEWIAAVSSQAGIIDADDWIKVQQTLEANKEAYPALGKTHNAMLTKVMKCAKCGSRMRIEHGHVSKKTGEKHYYYVCSLKKTSKGSRCDNKNGKVREIDPAVISQLKELHMNRKAIIDKLREKNKKLRETATSLNKEKILNSTIIEKEKQIDNLMTKLSLDNDITDLIIEKVKKLKSELNELKIELKNVNNAKTEINETELNLSFIEMLLNKCSIIDTLDFEEQKQLIEAIVEKITWNGETHEMGIDLLGVNGPKKK